LDDDDMSHLDVQSKHTAAHSSSEYFPSAIDDFDIDPIEEEDSKVEMLSPVNNQQKNLTIHVSPDSISDEDDGIWINNGYTPNTLASTPGSPLQKKKYKNYSDNVNDAIDDVKMYENEINGSMDGRLSIIVDEKTNFTRTRAATTQVQTKKKKQSPDVNRRRSFQQSNGKNRMMNGLRSKSAVNWSDEEDEKNVNAFFEKLDIEESALKPAVIVSPQRINHHSHRSSAEKLEIYKQKLFSPKQHPISAPTDVVDAFQSGADAMKTMTGLMINASMNQQNKGSKRKKKKSKKQKSNPMQEYHSKKLLNDLDAQFGSEDHADTSFDGTMQFGTPKNSKMDLFSFGPSTKNKKGKKKKKKVGK